MNVIGLDLGTTTLSAVVVDADTGAVLETVNVPNGTELPRRHEFERAQDADAIAMKARALVEGLMARHDAGAIGIDGQMHGMLYVDAGGAAATPLYTWQDQRGEQPLEGATYAGALSALTGRRVATGYGMATHFWHVKNGAVPRGAVGLCTIGDYVGMRLTGRERPLLHVSSAASMGLFDDASGTWDAAAVAGAGMDPALLPEVTDRARALGELNGAAVACCVGDNQASFVGAARDAAGTVLVNLGTGGQVSMLSNAAPGGDLERRPLGDGKRILVGSALCGGRAYALLERFLRSCAALAGQEDAPLYDAMNRAALALPEGEWTLRVDTRFNGTRANPDLRGAVSGIGTENFDAPHLVAGTLLGMAEEMRGLYGQMLAAGATPAARLVGSGNAVRRNPALVRALERVFGLGLRIPAHAEEAAFGAALYAMVAAGIKRNLAEAQRLVAYQ